MRQAQANFKDDDSDIDDDDDDDDADADDKVFSQKYWIAKQQRLIAMTPTPKWYTSDDGKTLGGTFQSLPSWSEPNSEPQDVDS